MASLDTLYVKKTGPDLKVKKTFTAPLASLYVEPGFNIRHGEITPESVSELCYAYMSGAPIPPIVVEVQPNHRLKIIAGHRRYVALTTLVNDGNLQFERVELKHIDTDPASVIQFMVGENGHGRTNLNAVDLAIACQKLHNLGLNPAQIAATLSFSESKVNYHLTIAKMSDEVKQAIIDGLIAADFAADIFRKSGDAGVLAVLQPGEKVTRKSSGLWRPSMGKSVVSLFADVTAQITDNTVNISMTVEQWEKVQEAVKALGKESQQ